MTYKLSEGIKLGNCWAHLVCFLSFKDHCFHCPLSLKPLFNTYLSSYFGCSRGQDIYTLCLSILYLTCVSSSVSASTSHPWKFSLLSFNLVHLLYVYGKGDIRKFKGWRNHFNVLSLVNYSFISSFISESTKRKFTGQKFWSNLLVKNSYVHCYKGIFSNVLRAYLIK